MNHHKAYKLGNILGIAGVIVLLCLYLLSEINWLFYLIIAIAVLLMGAGIIIPAVFYRCPHCSGRLPLRMLSMPTYCPHCGEKLE